MAEENVTITNLHVGTDSLRAELNKSKEAFRQFKTEAEREKIDIAARTKFEKTEFTRQVNQAVREMQRVADANPVKVKVEGLFSSGGSPLSELSGFSALLRGGGIAAGATITLRALSEAMGKLTEQIKEGNASWQSFGDSILRSLPLFRQAIELGENATNAVNAQRAINEGLAATAPQEDVFNIQRGIRNQSKSEADKAAAAVEGALSAGAGEHATAGLEGADLARARVRQTAQERQDAVAKVIDEVQKQTERGPVEEQMAKLVEEQSRIEEDLQKTLAKIDEDEADRLGKEADRRMREAEKFAADAGEAALKAQEAKDKEDARSQEELDRTRERFLKVAEREAEITARMGAEAREAGLRASGHNQQADEAAAEEEIRRLFEQAGDDPDRQRSARIIGQAKLDALRRSRRVGGVSISGEDFGRRIQDAILASPDDPQKEWAISGIGEMRNAMRRGENPFGPSGSNAGQDALAKAAAELDDVTKRLNDARALAVIKR